MNDARPTCKSCVHWEADDRSGNGDGVCKRYPPVHWPHDPNGIDLSAQPFTHMDASCGEHPDFPAWRASRDGPPPKQDIDYSSPSYSRPVECLRLDGRSRRMVRRMKIQTVGDLARKRADELLDCKYFGQTSLTLVRAALAKHGMRLHGD
jgi:hypothetical protein